LTDSTTSQTTIPQLSKGQWVRLFAASLGMLLLNQLIEQALNLQMTESMRGETSAFVVTAMALFFNGVSIIWLQSVVLMVMVQAHHPETSSVPLGVKIGDFTREWLRSMGEVSLWMFAFVVPGLIRLIDYSLLPFICFFDSAYQKGEIDALETCRSLARGRRLKLWALWISLGLVLPILMSAFLGDYESLFEHPLSGTLIVAIEAAFQVLSFCIIWRIYSDAISYARPQP
jgi:hypothetical protein